MTPEIVERDRAQSVRQLVFRADEQRLLGRREPFGPARELQQAFTHQHERVGVVWVGGDGAPGRTHGDVVVPGRQCLASPSAHHVSQVVFLERSHDGLTRPPSVVRKSRDALHSTARVSPLETTSSVQALSLGRSAWPKLHLPEAAFVAWVETRARALEHVADSYLACAVAEQLEGAVDALLEAHRVLLTELARRAERAGLASEDFRQELIIRALLPRAGAPPRIADYRGTGPLGAWLRITGTRLLIQLIDRSRPAGRTEVPLEALLSDAIAWDSEDPHVAALRDEASAHLAAALREALSAVDAPTRALLRQHYVHRLGIDAVARLLGVHRSNAARRIVRARAQVLTEVRRGLTRRLSLVGRDVDSLVRLARSSLGLSLERLLEQ